MLSFVSTWKYRDEYTRFSKSSTILTVDCWETGSNMKVNPFNFENGQAAQRRPRHLFLSGKFWTFDGWLIIFKSCKTWLEIRERKGRSEKNLRVSILAFPALSRTEQPEAQTWILGIPHYWHGKMMTYVLEIFVLNMKAFGEPSSGKSIQFVFPAFSQCTFQRKVQKRRYKLSKSHFRSFERFVIEYLFMEKCSADCAHTERGRHMNYTTRWFWSQFEIEKGAGEKRGHEET